MRTEPLFWMIVGALWVVSVLVVWARCSGKSTGGVFVQAWKPLTAEEIERVMSDWAQDDPRWRATWDWLNAEYRATQLELLKPGADVQEQLVWKGRAQVLMVLREQLLGWRRKN